MLKKKKTLHVTSPKLNTRTASYSRVDKCLGHFNLSEELQLAS